MRLRVKHLAEHGAVGVWLEGQWAILVGKPDYICQVLRDKSRSLSRYVFHLRVPGSAATALFGENIIDSEGALHDGFSKHIKPGIEQRHDFSSLMAKSSQLAPEFLQLQTTAASGTGVSVSQPVLQWSASVYGEYFLDTEFDALKLENYNIQAILARQSRSVVAHPDNNKVIHRMNRARIDGTMSEFHYRSNRKQLFIARAENVESVLIFAMLELAKNTALQEQLFQEIEHALPADCSDEDL
ncbi:hypothetical protein NLG97_g2234 [Lecanicillium saksenae]|uniref:Uncharacterized protein n=1 Tax=Lecanicillium saksenae TaxID=468837 RepID=A0ACC1R1Q3_9HYPO|nr:hypothetical protein NLG97_g2234 [Lecanicillium saksenae]